MPWNPSNPECPRCGTAKDDDRHDGFATRVDVFFPDLVVAQATGLSTRSEAEKGQVGGLLCRNCGHLELLVATPKRFFPISAGVGDGG